MDKNGPAKHAKGRENEKTGCDFSRHLACLAGKSLSEFYERSLIEELTMDKNGPAKHAKGRENEKTNRVADLIFKEETYALVGMCFAVYRDKGCGFLEPVYQECMEIELRHNRVPAVAKPALSLSYRGVPLTQTYAPDFVCYGKIILELKAASQLTDEHRAQVLNYLNATGFELGLLVNFGHYPKLEWERIVQTRRSGQSGLPEDFQL